MDLCVRTFGDAGDPAILLIMGSSASMDWWEDDFCERLAAGSRFVVRYDHRDTGRSVSYEAGAPAYTGRDLIEDAVGVLDALRLTSAHLVGMSMGGAIAQVVALDYPDRVASLTLISTSPSGGDPDLPEMSAETGAEFAAVASPDWSDRAAVIDYQLQLARVCASRSSPFDEEELRRLAGRVLDRTSNVEASMTNHDFLEGSRPLEGAPPGPGRPDARHSRHRGPGAPVRPRTRTREREPWRRATSPRADGPRVAPEGLGARRSRDPRAHAGALERVLAYVARPESIDD